MIEALLVYSVLGGILFFLIKRKFKKRKDNKRIKLTKKFKTFPVKNAYFKPLTPPDWMEIDEEDDIMDLLLKTKCS